MKITYIEIEAEAEELKASRTFADTFVSLLGRIADKVSPEETESEEE